MQESNRPIVVVTHALPEEWLQPIRERCNLVVGPADAVEIAPELFQTLGQAQGMLTLLCDKVDERILGQAPRLRVISNYAVGFDNIDLKACTRLGIAVGNTPGVLTDATADLTMALLLAAARGLPQAATDARTGKWKKWEPAGWLGADLQGAVLGIVGMGKIGYAVAKRAAAFGTRILYTNLTPFPEAETGLGARKVDLETLLRESDFVSLHVPLTPETHHMIDEKALRMMKRRAILVNPARGSVVDLQALARALQEGWIAGAALDVTEPEPLPTDHILFSLPNCLIVPHIGSATRGTRQKMAEIACENLLAGLDGRRLPFCVNPQVYG